MLKFVLAKFFQFLFVYILASGAIFLAMHSLEDPVALKFSKHPDPEQIAAETRRLGLDRPLIVQYGHFHWRFFSLDWESSLLSGRRALDDVGLHFPATLELTAIALFLGTVFGAGAALIAREGRRPLLNRVIMSIASTGLVVPIFWVGLLSLALGALWLGWFPMGGRFDLASIPPPSVTGFLLVDSALSGDWDSFGMAVRHLVLPASCLAVYPAANVASVLHARLNEPGIVALRTALLARGVGRGSLLFRHLLRIGAAPVVTVLGTTFGALIGGAVLTETVFSWPGIGRYVISSILERDLFVAQYLLLMLIVIVFIVAFVCDLLAHWLMVESDEERADQ